MPDASMGPWQIGIRSNVLSFNGFQHKSPKMVVY